MRNEQVQKYLDMNYDDFTVHRLYLCLMNDSRFTPALIENCVDVGKKFIKSKSFDFYQFIVGVKNYVVKTLLNPAFNRQYKEISVKVSSPEVWQVSKIIADYIYENYLEDYKKSLKRGK